MSYCTLNDLRDILPKNITIGNSTIPTVTAARSDSITTSTANKYLYFASQYNLLLKLASVILFRNNNLFPPRSPPFGSKNRYLVIT